MKDKPNISETEWAVMRVVWAHGPCTAARIIDELVGQDSSWHPKTVKTLLNRLVKKRALGFSQEGRAYVYRARVREVDCVTAESESFLDRMFGGSLTPLVAHFVAQRKLSAGEVAELKRLLEKEEQK